MYRVEECWFIRIVWSIPEDEHIIMLLCYVRKNVLCLSVARPPYSTEDWGADPLQWLGRLADWLTLPSFFSGILLIYLFIPWNSKTICYIQTKATAAVTCAMCHQYYFPQERRTATRHQRSSLPPLYNSTLGPFEDSTLWPFDSLTFFDPSSFFDPLTLRPSSTWNSVYLLALL